LALGEFLRAARDALGRSCTPLEVATQGDLRYAACGDAGVWIVRAHDDGTFELIGVQDLRGSVDGFFAREGELWARVTSRSAIPIARAAGPSPNVPLSTLPLPTTSMPASTPVGPAAITPAAAPAIENEAAPLARGEVIETGPGYVVVDFGSADRVVDGSHVAFYQVTSDLLSGHSFGARRELLAVGIADSVASSRARVRLGVNERVPKGSQAELSGDPLTASQIAPPRSSGLWEVAFHARPFLVLEDLGFGLLVDARAGHRGEHFHAEALMQPIGFATAKDGGTVPTVSFLSASYDSHLFEIGLGVGGQTVYDTADDGLDPGTGATLVQRARLGALDGLNLEVFTYLVLFHSEFDFSGMRATGQIPLGRGGWLTLGGGGGTMGFAYGELGLRALLRGNGDRDSLFVTVTIGGADVFEDAGCSELECGTPFDYGGPTVGAGLEWRL
jgi:hypothetical protein